jgi:hypothetical protein
MPDSPGAPAFFADRCEGVSIPRIEIVCSLLRSVSQEADCVKPNDQFLGGVAGPRQRRTESCVCMGQIHSFLIERLNLLGGPLIQNNRGDYPKRWDLMDV